MYTFSTRNFGPLVLLISYLHDGYYRFELFFLKGDRFLLDDLLDLEEREDDLDFFLGSPSSSRFSSSSSRGDGMRLKRILGSGLTSIVTGSEEEFPKVSSPGMPLGLDLVTL